MEGNTNLYHIIDAVDSEKARYDKNIKEYLSDIQILARIVKYTVVEAEDLNIEEIIKCIDQKSVKVGETPVSPGLTNLGKVESNQTENVIPNEGYVTFDIRFSLFLKENEYKLIINIEAQKSSSPQKLKYHLENRITFYLSRLISSQKEVEFFHSDYDSIKKVYSIWICMDTNENRDSITKISLKADTVFGEATELPELDKMCGIIIRIREGENAEESQHILIALLEDLLRKESSEQKKKKLQEKYAIQMTTELERRVNVMCNLSEVIEEKGLEKGLEKGIEKGIEKGRLQLLLEMVEEKMISISDAAAKAVMTEEEFTKLLGQKGK